MRTYEALHRLIELFAASVGPLKIGAVPTPGSGPCSVQGYVRGSGDQRLRICVRRMPVATITAVSSSWRPATTSKEPGENP
jgi:hypothetical protein